MRIREMQILKCPNKKSFEDHLDVWKEIKKIAESKNCSFTWKILSQKDKTFQLNVYSNSKHDQMNVFIEVMQLLQSKNIEPAVVIKTENLDDAPAQIIREMKEVLNA